MLRTSWNTRFAPKRTLLAHGYERIDLNLCWNILRNHLPQTIATLEKILPPES